MKRKNGITLIALVITIIVLLILAAVTILALLGDNGIISKASQAKIKTLHENVYEEIELYANSYFLEKKENEFNGTLMEYFNRDESKPIIDENGIINVKNLLGSSQSLGNGTSIETGDVYALKEVDSDEGIKYEVVYYGKSETDVTSLGFVIDNGSSTSSDILKYAYLFRVNSEGELEINPYYSYYSGYHFVLISKNGYVLQNMSFIIPDVIDGQSVTSLNLRDKWDFGNPYGLFAYNSELKNIKLSDGLVSISSYVFYRCGLESIEIPESVSEIGESAFYKCNSLKTVYYTGTEEQWNQIKIGKDNKCLSNANIIYNYTGDDIKEYVEESTEKRDEEFFNYEIMDSSSAKACVTEAGSRFTRGLRIPQTYSLNGAVYDVVSVGTLYGSSLCTNELIIPKSVISIDDGMFGDGMLRTVYYEGSEEDFEKINIGSGNDALLEANIVYNYKY